MWIKMEKGFLNIARMRSIQRTATRNGFDVHAYYAEGDGKGEILATFAEAEEADAYMAAIEQILNDNKLLFDPKDVKPPRRMGFS